MNGTSPLFKKHPVSKALHLALCLVLLAIQAAPAHASLGDIWTQRLRRTAFTLPTPPTSRQKILSILNKHGVIQSLPDSGKEKPLIILIQDVHGVLEAQKNIGAMIKAILAVEPDTLVGLEGAQGPLPLSDFRHKNQWVNQETAAFLLDNGLITGAEYAGLAAQGEPSFFGVEDAPLYLRNAAAVKAALLEQPLARQKLEAEDARLRKEKLFTFSYTAIAFDASTALFDNGEMTLSEYAESLGRHINLRKGFPQISRLLKAAGAQKNLTLEKVNEDRGRYLSSLGQVLSPGKKAELADLEKMRGREGLAEAIYLNAVIKMGEAQGLRLEFYPHFQTYVRLVQESHSIQPELLFKELDRAEKKVWASLCPGKEGRKLAEDTRLFRLRKKLISLSLTPHEWNRYKLSGAGGVFSAFEAFYEAALERDQAMARNFLLYNPSTSSPFSILVAGGFHTPGLQARLSGHGAGVLVVSPKFPSKIHENPAKYLNLFLDHPFPAAGIFPMLVHLLPAPLATKPIDSDLNPSSSGFKSLWNQIQTLFERPAHFLQTIGNK